MCMYVHVLYVCACIFQYAFPPDMPVRFSWRKTCLRCCPPKSLQINFHRLGNVCMCLYCMYEYVSYVSACLVCIKLVFASIAATGTRITTESPHDRLLRRHPAGLTQGTPGHGRKHFFPPSLPAPTTRFRAPHPLSPRRRSLNRPPRTAGWSPRPDPSL